MTVREMHRKVRTQFDNVAAQTLDSFLPEEIDHYINRAVRQYVNQLRPPLRRERNTPKANEAQDKLRTLIDTETFTDADADFGNLPSVDNGQTVDVSTLSGYEYFIAARLSSSEYTLNCRLTTTTEFYEHAPTEENTPIFRKPVITESGDNLWILRPSNYPASPETLLLTYLKHPQKISSKVQVKIEVTAIDGANSNNPKLNIGTHSYEVVGDTGKVTTIDNFISNNEGNIYQNTGFRVKNESPHIVLESYDNPLTPLDVTVNNPSTSATANLSKAMTTSTTPLDLPEDTHQSIVDQTVMLIKRDLPQAQSQQQTEE
jgi:hypothetical protein